MKTLALKYRLLVKGETRSNSPKRESELKFWQDELFYNFLFYCFPVSLIAVIPGVFMALKDGYFLIAAVDLLCLLGVIVVTFVNRIDLKKRKLAIVVIFYTLAVFLVNTLGYVGPGIFYLFGITILIALIFPIIYAYWSILVNFLILSFFCFVIGLKLFDSMLIHQYGPGKWIAFSSNLIFLSIVLVALVNQIFKGLQLTISQKTMLQERYKSIFDSNPLPMWLFDTETLNFVDVNQAAVRHYGFTKNEFLLMTINDIRPLETAGEVKKLVSANRISQEFYSGYFKHIKKNSEQIDVKVESSPLIADGRDMRLVVVTDITSQLKGERDVLSSQTKIKKSESNLRAIFESAVEGFVLLDHKGEIITFNSKAKDYIKFNAIQTGFERGKSIFDFVEKSRHQYFRDILEKAYAGKIVEYDRKYRAGNKSGIWIHYTITPVYDRENISGCCITGRDITSAKTYVQKIEQQNKVLREISWMQSHVVRAPVARIIGLATMLHNDPLGNDTSVIADYLHQSAVELDNVIKKITVRSSSTS